MKSSSRSLARAHNFRFADAACSGQTLQQRVVPLVNTIGFAQSDPGIGTWKLNLAKSTYSPGPPPVLVGGIENQACAKAIT